MAVRALHRWRAGGPSALGWTLVGAVPGVVCCALTWIVTSELTARQESVAGHRAIQDDVLEGGDWFGTRSAALVLVAGLFVVGLGVGTFIGFVLTAEA